MNTIKQVQTGLLKYIEKELMPNAAQMGEAMLCNLCGRKTAQFMGIVTADGQINVDMLRSMALNFIPDSGISKEIMGVEIKFTKADVESIYRLIKEA